MKVHIKALTLLIVGVLVINFLSFGVPVFAAAAPSIGIPVGVGLPINEVAEDIYKCFKNAYEMFINDVFGLSSSYSYEDYDGNIKTATASTVKAQGLSLIDSGKVMYDSNGDGVISLVYYDESTQNNYFVDLTLEQYSIFLSTVTIDVDVDTYNGENVVSYYYSMPTYDSSIKSVLNGVIAEDDHTSIMWDMKHIHGVPQNELVVSSPLTIPCFDYLGLNYACTTNFDDPLIDIRYNSITKEDTGRYKFYYPFVITSDNTLYCLTSILDLYKISQIYLYFYNCSDAEKRYYEGITTVSTISGNDVNIYRLAFRFFKDNGKLYPALYLASYNNYYSNAYSKRQYTYGNPALSSTYNLFSDDNSFFNLSITPNINFVNNAYSEGFDTFFYSPLNKEYITSEELLKKDISLVGVFGVDGTSNTALKYNSSTISTAGNLLLTYDTLYTGGSSSTTSPLSDWQKAIYILAQQYGESYEDLLQKLDMIIDSQGNVTIVGADGIKYKVDALSKSFDEIYSKVENISGDLSELLEYLKSLNLEGLGSYIAALEGTLNDLNERDRDQTAVLGGISGTLTDLKSQLESLNLEGISSGVSSIDQTLSKIDAREQSISDFNSQFASMGIYGGMTFRLYDQCKYFLDNLFNYNDRNTPPNFSFYYDSNGDGVTETYPLIDFSFLETTLTNENTVDKSLWSTPIKIIDLIRYIIAICCYGLFVMRLIKRLPSFYGNGPLSLSG